jgi:hypothetical protein
VPAGTAAVVVRETALDPARPNPFNPRTEMRYRIATAGHVRLGVYDVGGRLITTLVDAARANGEYAVSWNGRNGAGERVGSGVYFVRLEAPGTTAVRRVTLIK